MKLSIIIPVRNGGENFRLCLNALMQSVRPPDEIIIVDDGSSDGSGDYSKQYANHVIRTGAEARGPAFARNLGAQKSGGDILVFLDADVSVHRDTLSRIENAFRTAPEMAALFGSYDDRPKDRGVVSLYKNLMHHYVHQHGKQNANTFWAGCGAIRRNVFSDVHGFDEKFSIPAIEDIELGERLTKAGYSIRLCPDIQVTHLKRWTFLTLLRTDIFSRAVPWTRLILQRGHIPDDLNLKVKSRLSALILWVMLFSLAGSFLNNNLLFAALASFPFLLFLNFDLYRFCIRNGGIFFGIASVFLHLLYLMYSSFVFLLLMGGHFLLLKRGILLVLVITLLKGMIWSIAIPPFHGPDEVENFKYGQQIERKHTIRVKDTEYITREDSIIMELVQHPAIPQALSLDVSDRKKIAEQIDRLNEPEVKNFPVKIPDHFALVPYFIKQHPPFYYMLLAGIQAPLEHYSILIRLLACRWFSVLLGLVIVYLAYKTGLQLWPEKEGLALLVAVLTTFQWRINRIFPVVGNAIPEIFFFSICLFLLVCGIRHGLNWKKGVGLGVTAGLGLLTRISFMGILPVFFLAFIWDVFQKRRRREPILHSILPWFIVVVCVAGIAGWWYFPVIVSKGESMLVAYGTLSKSILNPFSHLIHYSWDYNLRYVISMYWGNYTRIPHTLQSIMVLLIILFTLFVLWQIFRSSIHHGKTVSLLKTKETRFSLFLLGAATIGLVLFYLYLDYRIARDSGGSFHIQGRYFLPPVIGQMVWLLLGFFLLFPSRFRRTLLWCLGCGMILLNLGGFFYFVLPRYYGSGSLPALLERTTVLQPVSGTFILLLVALMMIMVFILVIILKRMLTFDSTNKIT
jgi:glycosyltransferase involved in cell wall biosynthesis